MSVSGVGEPSKGTRSSPGHVITAVRLISARCRLVDVKGGASRYDVTCGVDDVSNDACCVSEAWLLMLTLLMEFTTFVSAELLKSPLSVLLYQHLIITTAISK